MLEGCFVAGMKVLCQDKVGVGRNKTPSFKSTWSLKRESEYTINKLSLNWFHKNEFIKEKVYKAGKGNIYFLFAAVICLL